MSKRLRSNEDGSVLSLVELCYRTLTSGGCDWQQLESLPHSMLLSLLKHCAEERDAHKTRDEARGMRLQQLEEKETMRYHVDLPCAGRRVGQLEEPWPSDPLEQEVQQAAYDLRIEAMERLLLDVRSKWQTKPTEGRITGGEVFSPDYPHALSWNREERCFKMNRRWSDPGVDLYRVISSALLLYRACCLFEVDVNTTDLTDRYKCVWTVQLWHTASGRKLYLSERKGAATVSMAWPEVEDQQLSSDFLQLMNLLCGECPHTYDWTLAGCVA